MRKARLRSPGRTKRGYVLVMMAMSGIALMGVIGMAIDVGRLFSIRTEMQAYTDAAALAAAIELDGKTTGIAAALAAATKANNTWNFNTAAVPAPTVEFSTTGTGGWEANPGSPAGYVYVRVTATVSAPLAFMPVVMPSATRSFRQNVSSRSVAGQISISNFPAGASPYTAVSTDPTGPNFGLVPGNQYDIQWPQFNGSRAGCSVNGKGKGNVDDCFNSPPCPDESTASKEAVAKNWSSANNGYWGFDSNSDITKSVMDGLQTTPISVGQNIEPILTNGNKAAQGDVLDVRVGQDSSSATTTTAAYLADSNHNGRRLMVVPVVNPESSSVTTVLGFAQIMLISNGASSDFYKKGNGNEPFCAIYMGPFVLGGNDPGGASSGTGAYRVKLTE